MFSHSLRKIKSKLNLTEYINCVASEAKPPFLVVMPFSVEIFGKINY